MNVNAKIIVVIQITSIIFAFTFMYIKVVKETTSHLVKNISIFPDNLILVVCFPGNETSFERVVRIDLNGKFESMHGTVLTSPIIGENKQTVIFRAVIRVLCSSLGVVHEERVLRIKL